MEYCVMQR